MSNRLLPSLFLSHGSPMIALQPGAAGAFMQRLGRAVDATFGRPRAILVASAHTTVSRVAHGVVLLAAPYHSAVYDFGGFDPRLGRLRYDAPGAPALARQAAELLHGAGIAAHRVEQAGLDHGIWTALRYLYPAADVPVLPLAFVTGDSPAHQFALGAALAPLRGDGVLVVGTGSMTHDLRRLSIGGQRLPVESPEAPDVRAFRDWFAQRSAAGDWDSLLDYRRQAPYAVAHHPTDEHLLPWFIAAGAAADEPGTAPLRLHDSVTYGCLGMDAYGFGQTAGLLATAVDAPVLENDSHLT